MHPNFLAILVAAIVPLVVGFIYYNPKVFGTIWMKEAGLTHEQLKDTKMLPIFIVSLIYSFLIAFFLQTVVIHQNGAISLVGGDPLKALPSFNAFMADYANAFRTFKHGALHGALLGIFIVLPVIGTGAMYEKRSFKYVLIASGYWIVSMAIMGAIICGWV
jgi:Protein of unknown function (DUF1761)